MDSLLLYQPEHRILVSADALWEHGFGIVFPEFFDEPGFAAQEATLQMLEGLAVDIVIPGHGPMFSDFKPALERARQRLAYFQSNPERHALLGDEGGAVVHAARSRARAARRIWRRPTANCR